MAVSPLRTNFPETPKDILPQFDSPSTDVKMGEDYRIRGYLYNLREPRYPVTGPIGNRHEAKKFPMKTSLVKGLPVMPPSTPKGFVHGSPTIGTYTEKDRKEKRYNLKLLEKTSADLRKIQLQQDERQRFMKEFEERKAQDHKKTVKEKEEDLKMLQSYNPFGKPGYGAPRGHGKRSMAMTNALGSKDGVGLVRVSAKPLDDKSNYPANPLKVQRYEDDRMRRYKVDTKTAEKYRKELDALVDVKQHNKKIIRDLDKKREDGMTGYDPFGKPGAGAPNRDEQGNIRMSRKHHFTSPQKFTADETDNAKNPWLKLGQPPKREGYRFPRAGDHGIHEFIEPNSDESEIFLRRHVGGGGEPLVNSQGEKRTKRVGLLTTIHGARRTENVTKVATPEEIRKRPDRISPWGRPGAGAPLKNSQGEIVKNTKGRIQHESLGYSKTEEETMERAKRLYRDELMDGINRQRNIRDEEKNYLRLPPGDVPSWFSKGKVGRPQRDPITGIIVPQKRMMSDVTAQKFNSDRPRDVEKYYQDLQKMAEERYQKKMEERKRVIQQEMKHAEAANAFFHRPGHGAPHEKGTVRRKFSNNAITAQFQHGTRVPLVPGPATLDSVLNLTRREQVKAVPANPGSLNKPKRKKETVDSAKATVSNKRLSEPVSPENLSSKCRHQLTDIRKSNNVFSNSPERNKQRQGSTVNNAKIEPFPYAVMAPWAVDA
ncbi:uncharacterized protein LOC143471065 isoform X4 [Clavelina lepadiformis]|uniref:uncharacterized protein LOC143471065 isoform X4 n=1 Tax=Clavelina lepadiformis TaxID=159417 RepID=UPI0040433A89